MFHPTIVDRRLASMTRSIRATSDPSFTFQEFPVDECVQRTADLAALWSPDTSTLSRSLTGAEERWIAHEISRCKVDFNYFLPRYCWIKSKQAELVRVRPTYVQELFLKKVAEREFETISRPHGDGILFAAMKARQLGISTIVDCILAHRNIFYSNITSIVAADVDDHTQNLYELILRIIEGLPWWMLPRSADSKRDYRAKGKLITFADQDSVIRFSSGKNMQGGQDQEKGSIGTGSTPHQFHISEFALWANAEQIYDSLLPAVPMSPRSFGVIESTAKGRGNEWHLTWERAKKGLGRLRPVFFPYYTDPNDYRLPVPPDWSPDEGTIQHAARVEATSAQWVGHTVRLTPEQMYWYERTYAEYLDGRILNKFFAEYAADDDEAFQSSTLSVFPPELVAQLRASTYRKPVYVEVRPRTDLRSEANG